MLTDMDDVQMKVKKNGMVIDLKTQEPEVNLRLSQVLTVIESRHMNPKILVQFDVTASLQS